MKVRVQGKFRLFVLMSAVLATTCCACLVSQVAAQEAAPRDIQVPASAPPADETKPQTAATETPDSDKAAKKKQRRGSFVIAPLPIVSPALGSGLIPVAGYIFPFQTKDETSPPSIIGAAGLITDNDSRAFALAADMYFKQATYELKSFYFRGNLDYSTYGVGYADGNAGLKLPLEQTGQLFFMEALRSIPWKFFVGGRFITGNSLISIKPTTAAETAPIPPDVGLQTNLRALGVALTRDSRPNRFYPVKGSVIDFTGDFFAKRLGSKYSYQSYKFTANKYFTLGEKQVLAYNLFLCGTGGEPPFYGNCIYGARNELRGYTAGRYLDRYMVATQLEYRLVLRWRFGIVGFGGIGGVAPSIGDFRGDQLLPAGGTGIRFLLTKKFHVNLRTDFAWGKDNTTWSMGVGEAF